MKISHSVGGFPSLWNETKQNMSQMSTKTSTWMCLGFKVYIGDSLTLKWSNFLCHMIKFINAVFSIYMYSLSTFVCGNNKVNCCCGFSCEHMAILCKQAMNQNILVSTPLLTKCSKSIEFLTNKILPKSGAALQSNNTIYHRVRKSAHWLQTLLAVDISKNNTE